MRIEQVMPVLSVPDVAQAVAFYSHLGFKVAKQMEGWAIMSHGDVQVMFALPNALMPYDKPQLTGSLYFRVDDAAGLWQQLKDTVKVSYPLEDFSYGMREFAIVDPNGYLLQFGQEL